MPKIALGICIGDEEYAKRFHAILMNYYTEQFRLFRYSSVEELQNPGEQKLDGILLADLTEDELAEMLDKRTEKLIYLWDEDQLPERRGENLALVEKYTDVNQIVEEIMRHIGLEIREVCEQGMITQRKRCIGIYSLCESELQLPFALTLASILSEKEKVLVLDLQENSGFSQYGRPEEAPGIEDLLLLAKQRKQGGSRLLEAVGHLEHVDFVYPARNTECLCEAGGEIYRNLIEMIRDELDYEVVLINFGSRFQGFFALLEQCSEIYLMQKNNGIGKWREFEFAEELSRKGYGNLEQRIRKVEIPYIAGSASTCERIIEMWKWNEFGDIIRKMTLQGACVG